MLPCIPDAHTAVHTCRCENAGSIAAGALPLHILNGCCVRREWGCTHTPTSFAGLPKKDSVRAVPRKELACTVRVEIHGVTLRRVLRAGEYGLWFICGRRFSGIIQH